MLLRILMSVNKTRTPIQNISNSIERYTPYRINPRRMVETYLLIFIIGLLNLYSIFKDIEFRIADSLLGGSIILKEKNIGIIIFISIFFFIIFTTRDLQEQNYLNPDISSREKRSGLSISDSSSGKLPPLFEIETSDVGDGNSRRSKIEIKIILLLSLIGIILLFIAEDLFILYLGLELYSLSSYLLVLSIVNNIVSKYSIIYFLIGNISSSVILIGLAFLYYSFGTLNYTKLLHFIYTTKYISSSDNLGLLYSDIFSNTYSVGIIFIIIGLLFKIGAFPFQFWVLRIYPYIDTYLLTFLLLLPKITYLYVLLEILGLEVNNFIRLLILFSSFGSILLGSILGFNYSKFKFILTLSSLLNVGFFLLLLSLFSFYYFLFGIYSSDLVRDLELSPRSKSFTDITLPHIQSMDYIINSLEDCNLTFFYYILIYSINTFNIFFLFLQASRLSLHKYKSRTFSSRDNSYEFNLGISAAQIFSKKLFSGEIFSLFWNNKLFLIFLFLSFFSLIGIPPLAGFFPKFLLLLNLYSANHSLYLFSIFVLLLSTIFSSFYYLLFIINSSFSINNPTKNIFCFTSFNKPKNSHMFEFYNCELSFYISFFSYFLLLFFLFLPYLSPFLFLFSL